MKLIATIVGLAIAGGTAMASEATAKIKVKGMTCGSCVATVKKALDATKGVKRADVSLENRLATVVYENSQVTEKQIREAINKTGFVAELDKTGN